VYTTIASPTAANFSDTALTNGLTYSYVVSAVNSAGESADSAAVTATPQAPQQTNAAHIYFIDIGQGASTLIVGPTGKTLLVDGGPDASGSAVLGVLNALHINSLDNTVLTHYHIDHDSGLTAVLNAGKVGGIAYDNGDDPAVQPPSLTGSTGTAYTAYRNATAHAGGRHTIAAGDVIDLGGGMRATCLAAGGHLLGDGRVPISNTDLNSESISLLVEYNDFDFLISGDLTGGGSTSTATTPDVETFVGQLAGDVDIVQLDHHGSTTASNQRFLREIHAEVAVAQAGSTNTFGHPNRETVNKFLNTPDTANNTFAGQTIPPFTGHGTVFYEMEPPVAGDSRVTLQAWVASPITGQGTIEVDTDGSTNYTVHSFVGNAVNHTYPVDGASLGITTTFPPTVIPSIVPAVPLATDTVAVNAQVNPAPSSVTLTWSANGGAPVTQTMSFAGGNIWTFAIPPQSNGTRVDYTVTATSAAGKTTSYSNGYFSGTTAVSTLRAPSSLNSLGEPLYAGYPVRVQGVITAGTGIYNSGANNDDYLEDSTGGINIWRTTDPQSPAMQATSTGETDSITGLLGNSVGRLRVEVTPPFASTTTPYLVTQIAPGSGVTVPAPHSLGEIATSPESFEGRLVSIANCHVVAGTIPSSASDDAFLTVNDGTANFTLKVDKDTDLPGASTPSGTFTLVGIVQQDAILRPFIGSYDIAPRGRTDLGLPPGTSPATSIAAARIDAVDNTDGSPGADFVPDLLNQNVHVRGVVTTINFRPTGTEYYIQDDTAGVDVFSSATIFGNYPIGTYLDVTGPITQFNGLTEINVGSNFRNIVVVPNGPALPAPQLVTLSQLGNGGAGELLEGKLIQVNNVSAPAGSWPANNNVNASDGTGSAQIRIVAATDIDGTPVPTVPFSITGVVGQFDSSAPFDSGYQIFPRSLADIVPALSAAPSPFSAGTVTLGQSSTSSISITNHGTTPVTLNSAFAISGDASFTASAPANLTIAPGDSTTTDVTFAPTTTGNKSATLAIASNIGTINVGLSGIGACGTITLSSSIPGGTYGGVYSTTLTASGGAAPYNYVVTGGSLPGGTSLAASGVLAGTLNAPGTFTFTVQATDTFSCTGSQSYTVTIDKPALVATADNASRLYGAANPAFTGTFTGAVASDNLSVSFTTTATNISGVASYAITPVINDPNGRIGNYNVTVNAGTLTIKPAPLTVAAISVSRPYGSANPALGVTYSGFVLTDSPASLDGTLSVATTAISTSAVDAYPIVASGLTSTNYAIAFVPATLNVTPVTLHVKADDQSIVFGDPLPAFTATITGFVLDETNAIVTGSPALSTTATASSLPGDYDINVAQGSLAAPNYTFDFATGTLHIAGLTDSLQALIADLTTLRTNATDKLVQVKLDDAIKHLTNAVAPNLWLDSIHPQPKGASTVFTETKGAAIDLVFLQLQADLSRLVANDRMLALTAINDAVARNAAAKSIDAARTELSKGDADVAAQQYESGLEHYRNAWSKAAGA